MDKQWESNEISLWINNDEGFYRLARKSKSPKDLLERFEMLGFWKLAGIELTVENLKEAWQDAQS